MHFKKSHENGSLMVEVIAVLALLGVMGTLMFRQIQRRNEELDNINMASEIRMIKEATMAYIQANKAMLEANYCPPIGDKDILSDKLPLDRVEDFLPDNWISSTDGDGNRLGDGIVHEYQIYLSCYRINSESADNRLAMYGTIVPNGSGSTPLPSNMTSRRAARVATLIGADGGVYENGEFVGTMGAWQIDCTADGMCCQNPDAKSCELANARTDNFYVATTGMDIYIPEAEKTADNTVAVPHNIAFQRLHSTEYFSVGSDNVNCVTDAIVNAETGNYTFKHEDLGTDPLGNPIAQNDSIGNVGSTTGCDPLFWVGTVAGGDDHSGNGNVYVKKNLLVGRDNENNRQAVAMETGSTNWDNAITVFDIRGNGRLTLNGAGEVVGRVVLDEHGNSKGYKLDAENGEIILFDEVRTNIGGHLRTVQMPTLRLKNGRMETNVEAEYYNNGIRQKDVYAVDPAGESLMHDIRLTARGGAKLSEILPDYILKRTQTITRTAGGNESVPKPTCPRGYAAAISVTPISYSQYVRSASLNVNLVTNSVNGSTEHQHEITGNVNNMAINGNTLTVSGTGDVAGTTLTLTQFPPVSVAISNGASSDWAVGLTYGGQAPTNDDPITALAQTYCVFRDTRRGIAHDEAYGGVSETGFHIDSKEAGVLSPGRDPKPCTDDVDCANTEACDSSEHVCKLLGSCTEEDGEAVSGKQNTYCIKGQQVYLECFENTDCEGENRSCRNNRCAKSGL